MSYSGVSVSDEWSKRFFEVDRKFQNEKTAAFQLLREPRNFYKVAAGYREAFPSEV
tara:strand:- start:392 stop:559 length:168 start_codon:yes stop_codon:yes gene_type:complete